MEFIAGGHQYLLEKSAVFILPASDPKHDLKYAKYKIHVYGAN